MVATVEGKQTDYTLKTTELSKTYPNGTQAITAIDFAVKHDDMIVILGPSGAGKSTLLRCLNRLLVPTEGCIELNGEDISHVSGSRLRRVREHVGMIFQQFNLVRRLTVLDNVLAGRLPHCHNPMTRGLSLMRVFSRHEKEFAFECLRKVGIETLAYQRADTLSGGQQQRVAIARALAQEPLIFLADEPVASLDVASSHTVMEILASIHEQDGIPVIVNLHQIELGCHYGKRIVGMARGHIVFDGPPNNLNQPEIEGIYGIQVDRRTGLPMSHRVNKATR